jgi:hypothetical protein
MRQDPWRGQGDVCKRLIFVNLPHRRIGKVKACAAIRSPATMKLALLVCNSYFMDRVMKILKDNGIDYFTSWDKARGKGHGTEPHLGTGGFGSTNSVTMVAFEDDAPLEGLIRSIKLVNQETRRAADHIRLFQLPLERIV